MSVNIIIQARMGATRLPGKVLMPFVGEYSFLEWIVERCKQATVDKVIVATSDSSKDDPVAEFCKQKGYDCVRGSEDDVLERYWLATQQYPSDIIVRVTADNPFVDITEIDRMVEALVNENLDYASTHPAGLPVGTGAEAFTHTSFERVHMHATTPYEHEHVTPFYYQEHKDEFVQRTIAPAQLHPFASKIRLTLDTPQDHEFLTRLAQQLGLTTPAAQPGTHEIVSFLESHPELVAINQEVVQKTFPKA